jgi:hypothetical protein
MSGEEYGEADPLQASSNKLGEAALGKLATSNKCQVTSWSNTQRRKAALGSRSSALGKTGNTQRRGAEYSKRTPNASNKMGSFELAAEGGPAERDSPRREPSV